MYEKQSEGSSLVPRRIWMLLALLAVFIGIFCFVLYDLQVVHGAEYLEQSKRTIVETETVDASRGDVLDSLGRVLITNRTCYQTTLDLSLMGKAELRNETLQELLEICGEQGVEWIDSLSISTQAPFSFTTETPYFSTSTDEETGEKVRTLTRLGQLSVKLKWLSENPAEEWDTELPDAEELLTQMCEYFELEGGPTEENRRIAGVLYELFLRSKDVYWNSYIFAEDVDIEFISIVKERGLAGVQFETTTARQYNTSYAAHLLGRVGPIYAEEAETYKALGYSLDSTVGKDGLEKAFEEYLRGTSGERILETNASGKIVSESWVVDPETGEEQSPSPGYNIVTTLELPLQEAVERALAKYIATMPEEQPAAAVIVDVNNGGIKAMASYPTYDLANFSSVWNEIRTDPLKPMYNRAIQGRYAPGSTFKMVTAIGAMEEGIITPTDEILDTGAYTYYTSNIAAAPKCWIFRQYGGTHGAVNVSEAITESCNVFFFDVGRRLGIDKLNLYARMFGLGETTGIEIAGEAAGVVAGREYTETVLHQTWYEGSTLSVAIGQENNQFTPLQLANYIATLVNGGNHYSTHLLKEVKSSDYSEIIYTREAELLDTIQIDPEHLEAVKKGMLAVTETGSAAKYFTDLDVKVGAKTGSAQVAADSEANAVFVAFAPYDDPEIAMCIVVEKGGSGTEVGAIAADILSYYFNSESAVDSEQAENTLIR